MNKIYKFLFYIFLYSSLFGFVWQIQVVDTAGNVGKYSSIAIDNLNRYYISYYDSTNGDLKFAYFDGSNWNIEVVDGLLSDVGKWTSISLDLNNRPHISYYDVTNGNLKYAYFNGTSWQIETVDGFTSDVGQYSSIYVDQNGVPHISYFDATNTSLKYAYKSSSIWITDTVDNSADVGRYTSISVDNTGTVHISYHDLTNNALKYAKGKYGSWTLSSVLNNRFGHFTSISLDGNNYPFISHRKYGGGGNEGLILSFWDGTQWQRRNIDLPSNNSLNGQWTSIEYDKKNNNVWISYYNGDSKDLKLAYSQDPNYNTFFVISVDTVSDVGISSSLALTTYGTPVISYYFAKGDLKIAEYKDVDPPGPPLNLSANGSNPSPWNNTGIFELIWTNPQDETGIRRALYKLYSPPTSNFDTTGTLRPNSPDTVIISAEGIIPLYLWLQDNAGNLNYNNRSTVYLRYDISKPAGSRIKITKKYSNSNTYNIVWTKGSDSGNPPSGIRGYNVYYKDGNNPWTLWLSNHPDTEEIFAGLDNHIYFFEAVSIDSAGNEEVSSGVPEDTLIFDLTAPSAPQNLYANGSSPSPWTNSPQFIITWTEPNDFSGISKRLYKLFAPPNSSFDTTGTFHKSPDTISVISEGIIDLYLWFQDSALNVNHNNKGSVKLRYDKTGPVNATVKIPEKSTNQISYTVSWSRGSDNLSGIKFYELYYKVKGGIFSLYQSNIPDTFTIFNFTLTDTFYYFEVVSVDSAGNKEVLAGIAEDSIFVDFKAPSSPSNLLANGSNPSPWSNTGQFILTWTEPYDISGIKDRFYKLNSPPQSSYDTTGSFHKSPDTLNLTVAGIVPLYLFLRDSFDNVNHNNYASINLRYDPIPPQGANAQTPLYSTKDTLIISWTQGFDQGGSGIKSYDVYYKDGIGPWNLLKGDTNSLSCIFIGLDGHKYYFEVVSRDSAGNLEVRNFLPEDSVIFDLTSPTIISIEPPHGSLNVPVNTDIKIGFSEKLNKATVIDTNFEIQGKKSGFHTFNLTYDSLNYICTLIPHAGFSSQETVFIRVSQNIRDVAGNNLGGQKVFFFITELKPDTEGPISITSINPISPEPFNYLDINVFVSDTGRGNSLITYAEFFIDLIGQDGTGIPLEPLDGSYDENIEEVYKKIDLVPLNFKKGETHYIFVHAKDINNNFGKFDTLMFTVSPDDDSLPPSFTQFTQGYMDPNTDFYIKGIIQDASGVYDDTTGSQGQGVYILWDNDGEIDTTFKEVKLDRLSGDTFMTINKIPGQISGEIVYSVYGYDNDFDTGHPGDRKKGQSAIFKIIFKVPMNVNLAYSPNLVYIGDSLSVEISANISFSEPPVCSLITSKGSLKGEIYLYKMSESIYKGKIFTEGADIGKAKIIAHYKDYGVPKKIEDTVLINARGEFLPENTVYVWPNPLNSEGNFHFYINQNAEVNLEIFDIRGKKIMETRGVFKGGVKPHTINSNAIKLNLQNLAPGIYIFRLKADAIDTKESKTVLKKFAIVR